MNIIICNKNLYKVSYFGPGRDRDNMAKLEIINGVTELLFRQLIVSSSTFK